MSPPYLLTLSVLALLVVRLNCQCTDQETSVASQEFKDCVDKKEYSLIHLDKAREDKKEFICAVFEQISDECSKALAKCRSRPARRTYAKGSTSFGGAMAPRCLALIAGRRCASSA